MPIYEYICDEGHCTEEMRRVQLRDSPCDCRVCGQEALRIVSRPAPTHVSRMEGGHNGQKYHRQAGIWYSSYEELDRKAREKGLYPEGPTVKASWEKIDEASYSAKQEENQKIIKRIREDKARNAELAKVSNGYTALSQEKALSKKAPEKVKLKNTPKKGETI